MSLDKHRESLVKYCYDVSKVSLAIAVLNPVVTKSKNPALFEVALGVGATLVFLSLAILLEKDVKA